jgi:hypothetical protein
MKQKHYQKSEGYFKYNFIGRMDPHMCKTQLVGEMAERSSWYRLPLLDLEPQRYVQVTMKKFWNNL